MSLLVFGTIGTKTKLILAMESAESYDEDNW